MFVKALRSFLTAVKLYSPLFIRCCATKHGLRVTAKGVKRRSKQRLEKRNIALKMAKAPTKAALPDTSSDQAADAKPKEVPWRANLNMQLICRDCKEYPPNLIEEFSNGDMVCGTCGLVLGDRIVDTRSEWRTFSNDDQASDDPSRVGEAANPLLNGSQLQTTIAFSNSGGRSLDLHRTQAKSTADKGNKYLSEAYKVIMTFCDVLSIPSQGAVDAKGLFKMVADAGAFKNKSQDAIIAGCIFISCRQNSFPRTFREIYALTKVSKKEIGRIFKGLEKFFAAQNQKKVASGEGESSRKTTLIWDVVLM